MARARIPDFPRLSGRLYFFPALLTLGEVLPWLLTAIGAVAGAAGGLSAKTARRFVIFGFSLLFFGLAAALFIRAMPDKAVREEGTRLTVREALPIPVALSGTAAENGAQSETFGPLWTKSLKKQVLATPVIAPGLLVYGSYEGSVEALSLKDGAPVWSLPQAAPVFSVYSGEDGLIYASEGLHETPFAHLTVIGPEKGTPLWQREFLGHIEQAPLIAGQTLWTGAGPGGLWALGRDKGNILWHSAIGHMDSTPLLLKDRIFAEAQPGDEKSGTVLYILNAKSGAVATRLPLPGQPWGSPVVGHDDATILTTTGQGQIGVFRTTDAGWAFCIAAEGGKIVWRKKLPGMPIQPDIRVPGTDIVVYTLKTGELAALDARDGSRLWQARAGAEMQAAAVLLEGEGEPLVAAMSYDGLFTVRSALTGEERARYAFKQTSTSSPAAKDDAVYVTTAHGVTLFGGVHALRKAQ